MKWFQKLRGVEHANPVQPSPTYEPSARDPEPEREPEWAPGQLVVEHAGRIRVRANTRAEAKLAIKEVKLKKREMQATRREITQEIAAVRAEYRSKAAGRHSTVGLGRGTTGRIVRAGIQAKRRQERMSTDDAVTALEAERNSFDASILEIDRLILKLEQYVAGPED